MHPTYYLGIMLCLSLGFSSTTKADDFTIEPYLGYSSFKYQVVGDIDKSKYGTVLGGKGGVYVTDKIFLGLDYHLGGPYKLVSTNGDFANFGIDTIEFFNKMWGAGIGFITSGKKIRLWAGYYYDAAVDEIQTRGQLKGTALKTSVGYEFAPKLFANLEACESSFIKYTGAYGDVQNLTPAVKVQLIFISVSSVINL